MQIYSANVVKALSALTEEEVAGLNATYTETLGALLELARTAHEQNARRAQTAQKESLRKVYRDEAATFAAVARALDHAHDKIERILHNGVVADVSADAPRA